MAGGKRRNTPQIGHKPPPPDKGARIVALDRLRGLAMILMVLDHAWVYFSRSENYPLLPNELPQTETAMFLALWAPKFCAPVFVLLAGIGARLQRDRGKSAGKLAGYLFLRGLLLIALEVTVVHASVYFNFDYRTFVPLILWPIGWAMIVLAALVRLPPRVVGGIGLAVLLGHNLLDGIAAPSEGPLRNLWILFVHAQGDRIQAGGTLLIIGGAILPWAGLMAAGYGLGGLFQLPRERRRGLLLGAGVAMCLAFVVLRFANGYGDPAPWRMYPAFRDTLFSFVNVTTIPPSLLGLLMTLGPSALLWAAFERESIRESPLDTLGRAPLLFYLLQWPLLHLLAMGAAIATGRNVGWLFAAFDPNTSRPYGWTPADGYPVAALYVAAVVTVLLAYPLCRAFANYKRRHKAAWLSYL